MTNTFRILAVGERFNFYKTWTPTNPATNHSFRLRKSFGFYRHGNKRLSNLGVHWTDGINLLWPSHEIGSWNRLEARAVVRAIRPDAEDYDLIVLFGRRVCNAFIVPFEICNPHSQGKGIYLPMPHPSGLNRMWNDPKVVEKVRRTWKSIEQNVE